MRMNVNYGRYCEKLEVSYVPRVGEVLTVVGKCRGIVEDVHHVIDPSNSNHYVEVWLRE